jgi:integrase
MRTGELAAIDPEDIHLDTRGINIDDSVSFGKNQPIRKGTTKTEAGVRTVPICDLLYEVFEDSLSQSNAGPLFRMKNGQPITKIGMRRAFETLNRHMKKQADVLGNTFIAIRPHDCRHTYTTALYDAGLFEKDIKYVQYLLGHKDIHTTLQIYAHLTRQRMKKGVGSVVSLLNKWVTEIPPHTVE